MIKNKYKKKALRDNLHQPPGTPFYVGDKQVKFKIEVIHYDVEHHLKREDVSLEELPNHLQSDQVNWVRITGINESSQVERLGKSFGLHNLLIEDVLNTTQYPKIEEYDNGLFLVLKMLRNEDKRLKKEQIAVFYNTKYIITFQETDTNYFQNLLKRIAMGEGRIRKNGADYLFYAILDHLVDDYFLVADELMEKADLLEEKLFAKTVSDEISFSIQELKREVLSLRRVVQPMREIAKKMDQLKAEYFQKKTHPYLRDLTDHILHVTENVERCREIAWSLMEMYMASISNRMNEVMKMLTVMASIFIPLTFIAGIYGMNFEYMPELTYKYAYFVVLGVMLLLLLFMLWYFKRKKWI